MTKLTDYFKRMLEESGRPKEKERAELKKAASGRDELEETLSRIDAGYESSAAGSRLPDPPQYEKMEYEAPDDEALKAQAESSLEGYKQNSLAGIESETEASRLQKEREKEAAAKSAEEASRRIAEGYDAAAQNFSDDALKRGLARSSIAVNKSAELAGEKASALARAAADAETAAQEIESEISALTVSRQKALDSFNIAYAAKVTEKIAELTAARDKKAAEVLKYNNDLLEQQKKDAYDKARLESELESESLNREKTKEELGTRDPALAEKNLAKYDAVRGYLLTMTAAEAAAAVKTDALVRDSLTDYYYYKLYNEFCK